MYQLYHLGSRSHCRSNPCVPAMGGIDRDPIFLGICWPKRSMSQFVYL